MIKKWNESFKTVLSILKKLLGANCIHATIATNILLFFYPLAVGKQINRIGFFFLEIIL